MCLLSEEGAACNCIIRGMTPILSQTVHIIIIFRAKVLSTVSLALCLTLSDGLFYETTIDSRTDSQSGSITHYNSL